MAKPKVVVTFELPSLVSRRKLESSADVVRVESPAQLKRELRDADALITLLTQKVDERLLDQAPRLKVVGNYAVGVDNVDLRACSRRGVQVVNTPGVLTRATAELALTLLLAAARRVFEGEELCRSGRFSGWKPDLLLGLQLQGRRAVLVGPGRIGRETARLFRGIGLRVSWIRRLDSEKRISKLLQSAQVLSLHLPLSTRTRHWLNAGRIRQLPPDAIVINTTRGPTIDERALIQALQKRRIFAAGLDVYEREPLIPQALRKLPNAVLLPHVGSATRETRDAMARLVVDGVLGVLHGKRPRNTVR